jgi:hypothetical protein
MQLVTGGTILVEDGTRAFHGKLFAFSTLVDILDGNDVKESSAGTQSSITRRVENVRAIPVVPDMPGGGFRWLE